ncbi:BTAD domain-containing putative transcriptional regulator [Nonomuraea sp. NPDC050404]|uniref:AfsR/SARP family transcriptional regulator n=1 Tax=Nonomuraea sp. NPDC050404 TaxID=3155783 RepID=UPI00340F9288
MPEVTIRLLGPFEVRLRDRTVRINSKRQRALLASLALTAGQVVPVEVLAERIWGAELPASPREAVQNNVHRLRRLLGPELVRSAVDGYLLDVDPDEVDAARFGTLARAAEQAEGEEPARARELLRQALELWRGEPLGDVASDSLERDHAPALTERHLAAVERRIDLDLRIGDRAPSELIAELRTLTARFPVRESLWERLLTVLIGDGRQAEALETYERVRSLLAATLGADPSAELRRLHQRLLAGEAPSPEPAAPERWRVTPRELPQAPGGFAGRAAELAALDEELDRWGDGALGLVAIHGVGGAGKSALAVHWAWRRQERFPDGQLHLDLRGYGPGQPVTPEAALGRLLRAIGTPPERVPGDAGEAAALLRSRLAGRRMLLVLDNAYDAEHVRPLLPGSHCFVIVTSRSGLRGLAVRDGARRLVLRELPDADALELLTAAISRERAVAEPEALAELARLCGRLPLALRIAAELGSRYPDRSLAALVEDLRQHRSPLDALADTDPVSDLRTVFSWSYDLLPPDLAGTFSRLGSYPGGDIGVPGAAALLDVAPPAARGLLDRLAAVHLVEEPRPGRFRLHDLLREYAVERAPEDGAQAALRRVLDWHLRAAHHARIVLGYSRPAPILGSIDESAVPLPELRSTREAFDWFAEERETLVAAVGAAERNGLSEHGWQLAYDLRDFFDRTRYFADWLAVGRWGLECAHRLGDPLAGYRAALSLGGAHSLSGAYDDAEAIWSIALEHAERLGDPAAVSRALSVLGLNCERADDFDRACEYGERAVAAARSAPDLIRGHALLNYGATEVRAGRYASAIGHNGEALAIYRALGAQQQSSALINLACAYERMADYPPALAHCQEALRLVREWSDLSGQVSALTTRGDIELAMGRPQTARASWEEARGLLEPADPGNAQLVRRLEDLDR